LSDSFFLGTRTFRIDDEPQSPRSVTAGLFDEIGFSSLFGIRSSVPGTRPGVEGGRDEVEGGFVSTRGLDEGAERSRSRMRARPT
jgi:hypothetical protein